VLAASREPRKDWAQLRCHYRVRDTNTILAMVAESLGVTILPELAIPTGTSGVVVLPITPATGRTIMLGVPSDAEPLPAATAFVAVATSIVTGLI
jgi:DNA-binding transcriptional LysR family regulator